MTMESKVPSMVENACPNPVLDRNITDVGRRAKLQRIDVVAKALMIFTQIRTNSIEQMESE